MLLIQKPLNLTKGRIDMTPRAKRDIRLLIALLLFSLAAIAGLVQSWVLLLYIESIIARDWTYFSNKFSVEAPASGPDVFCFGRCVAELPFLAGWIGLVAFILGMALLAYCWCKPRSPSH